MSGNNTNDPLGFSESIRQLQELNKALSSSFDSSLGMLNLPKLRTELQSANVSAEGLGIAFKNSGAQGQVAMNNLLGQIGKIDTGLKRSSSTVDKMFNTIANTARWGVVSSGFSAVLNSLHESVNYVKELDDAMTQIMLVTDYSREQMNDYAKSANEAAKALGNTTVGVMQGTQVFAQQGYNLEQSGQLAELSIKLANASEQDSATTSDQITALMNAYGLDKDTAALSKALDAWAEVANISAADVQELAKASQKAASSAATVGVSLDQMNAQIATIESVTRDAPEQIGNGLKTLYARFSDISLGKTLEDGVELGDVTGVLEKMGVQALTESGQMRNVGDIMEDLMVVWDSLDQTTKEAAGQTLAGKYQLNRFYALMDNSDMYNEYKTGSQGAEGTLDEMNAEKLDSFEGKAAKLQATLEGLFNSVFNPDNFYPAIDALTAFIEVINKMVDSVGGGQTVILGLVSAFGKLFSNNIAQMINDTNINKKIEQARKENALNVGDTLQQLGFRDPNTFQGNASKETVDFIMKGQEQLPNMSEKQVSEYNRILEDIIKNSNTVAIETEKIEKAARAAGIIGAAAGDTSLGTNLDGLRELLSEFDKGENLKQYSEVFKNGKKAALEYIESLQQIKTLSENFDKSSMDIDEKAKILESGFNRASNALQDLREAGILQTEDFEKMGIKLENLQDRMTNFANSADKDEEELRELTIEAGKFVEAIQSILTGRETTDSISKTLATAETNMSGAKAGLQRSFAEGNAFNEGMQNQNQIKSIIETTSAIGELTFAFQSFLNLGSIWQNQDLSEGEKFLQTIMNLSMIIPSIVTSYTQLINTLGILGPLKKADTLATLGQVQANIAEKESEIAAAAIKVKNAKEAVAEATANKERAELNVLLAQTKYQEIVADYELSVAEIDLALAKGNLSAAEKAELELRKANIVLKEKETAVNERLTMSQANLNKVIGFITSPLGIAIAAITTATLVINAYGDSLEKTRDKAKELAEESVSAADQTRSSVDNWQSLYDKWEETGEISDELVESSKELSKSLGIVGGDALITAGRFDVLKQSIEDAANAQYKDAVEDSLAAISAEQDVYDKNPSSTLPFIGSESVLSELKETAGEVRSILNFDGYHGEDVIQLGFNPGDNGSPIDMIDGMKDSIERMREAQNKLNTSTEEGKAAWQRYQNAIDATEKGLRGEHATAVMKEAEDAFNNRILVDDFQKEVQKLGTDVDAIINKFQTDSGTGGWFKLSKEGADQLGLAIRSVTDDAQRMALSIAQADMVFSEKMNEKASASIQTLVDQGQYSYSDFGVSNAAEYGEQATKYYKEQIENSGLTDQEKLEFLATIDWDSSLGDIAKQIEEINEHGLEDLPKLEFEPTLTNRSDFSAEKTEEILKESDMSANGLNRMASDIFSDKDALGDDAERIKSELQSLYDTIGEGQEPTEEQAEEIQKLRQEYADLGDTAKDIATYNVQMNEGVSELVKNWENYADVLANDATKGTADFYQVVGELDEIMSKILNIDVGVLSNGFYENEAAIDAMRRAAEGDVTAIDDLRALAAKDIILNLDIQGVTPEEENAIIKEQLLPMLSDFQSVLDGAQLGTTIDCDTSPFLAKIDELLRDSKISAEQASNILSSIGMEATIKYAEEDREQEVTQYFPSFHLEPAQEIQGPMPDGSTIPSFPRIVPDDPIPVTYTEKSKVSIPYLEGATYTGPGIETVGSESSGNNASPPSTSTPRSSTPRSSSPRSSNNNNNKEKTYKPKKKEKIKEEVDRYEKVNTQLDKTDALLDKIQQEADRLTGPIGRANMNKQIKLLQKENDLHREKLNIQLKERDELQRKLMKDGVTFDDNGFITNYAKVLKEKVKDVNYYIKQYNKSTSEDEQEMYEDLIDQAQKSLDEFKKNYSRYDDLQGKEIQETKNKLEELQNQMEDLRISAYKSAMEAQEDLKKLGDRYAHFSAVISKNKLDSPLGNLIENTERLNNLFSNGKKSALDYYNTLIKKEQERLKTAKNIDERKAIRSQIKFYQSQQKNINASDNLYAGGAIQAATDRVNRALYFLENPNIRNNPFRGNDAALQEELEAATESLEQIIEEAKKLVEDREKYIIDRIKELDENQQYFIDQLQTVNDHMEKTMDIYNLAFGEEHFDQMAKVYDRMAETTRQSFEQAKSNYKYWKSIWDKMSEKERMEDVGKAAREEVNKWKDAMLDSEKEMIEYWKEAFTATTKQALKDATKNIFGRSNLDDIEANWERDQNFANRYYDQYQKQQRIEALRLKYMNLLDNAQTASLETQQKIRDSMDQQVKYLSDQNNLSEYNVKYANAQLEILQKQIALEDARNNKNQMRLRRDSQGNYRYVYSEDKNDTRQKEQDLLQSQMNLYDMSKQNKADTTEAAFNLWRSTMEQLQALAERANQGDQEAIQAREELLKDYQKQMEAFGEEWAASTDGMIASVEWMANSGIESVEDVANKALEALKTNNKEALQEMGIEGDALLDKILENADAAEDAVTQAVGAMDNAIDTYKNHLIGNGGVISDIEKGYGGIKDAITTAKNATDELVDATKTFKEVIRPEDGVLQGYINQLETMRKNVYDLTNEKSAAVIATRKAQAAEQKAKTEALNYKTILDVKNGDKALERGAKYTLKKGTWVYYGRGGGQSDETGAKGFYLPRDMRVKIGTTQQAKDKSDPDILAKYPIAFYPTDNDLQEWGPRLNDDNSEKGKTEYHKQHEGWHLDETAFLNAIKMDTGGYTGEWANGSDKKNGRFAMLHQKEMVLNESDTKNILEAVEMVRTMTDVLKFIGDMSSYKGTGFNKLGGDTIKQRVEITAEFPNVSDSNEIETALLNLADSAYQYSHRER